MAADLAPDLPPEAVAALVAAWAQLYGLIGFELFGQFNRLVEDREPFFRHAVDQLAHGVGLVYPEPTGSSGKGTARAVPDDDRVVIRGGTGRYSVGSTRDHLARLTPPAARAV